jgi:rhodanese-related sulfurtransferase
LYVDTNKVLKLFIWPLASFVTQLWTMTMHRRSFFVTSTAFACGCFLPAPAMAAGEPARMSAPVAMAAALKGEVVLVDIRSREEWKQTGLAAPAKPISMHEGGFLQKLMEVADGDRNKPIAIICATGGRTRYLQHALAGAGFTNIIDVSEGMEGSPAGPGWLKRGLPVKPFAAE